MSFNLPTGELFVDSVEPNNSVAFTDNPEGEIDDWFHLYPKAKRLIFVRGKGPNRVEKTYVKSDK